MTTIPEALWRDDDGDGQVHQKWATVGELVQHAEIMRRRGSPDADELAETAREALRRAKGDPSVMLRDVVDQARPPTA
jgi:hypothetical protein